MAKSQQPLCHCFSFTHIQIEWRLDWSRLSTPLFPHQLTPLKGFKHDKVEMESREVASWKCDREWKKDEWGIWRMWLNHLYWGGSGWLLLEGQWAAFPHQSECFHGESQWMWWARVCFTGVIDLVCLGGLGLRSGTLQIRDKGLSCLFIEKEEGKKTDNKNPLQPL